MDFLILAPVLLFSIVVHEVAHAWQARREGDETAYRLGRITLNPIRHLDLTGSVIVPFMLWYFNAGFIFGWAKPVPVVPSNFRDYRAGDIRVSLAGIVSNFILAALSTVVLAMAVKLETVVPGEFARQVLAIVEQAAFFGLFINLILAVFNLIPIPPLDGSHVVYHLLPPAVGERYRNMGRYGILILMAIFFLKPDVFALVLWPVEFLMGIADWFVRLWI